MTFPEFIKEWRNATPYIIAKTSGSTGNPKVIELDKIFVRQSALRTNRFLNIDKGSRLHSCVSVDYIGGKMMAVRADVAGCRLTWENPSNRPLSNIGKEEVIDLLAVVPSQMIHILDNLDDMPAIKSVIIGGSAINPSLRDRICESGLNAYETYGMTETSSHIALRKIALPSQSGDFGEIASRCYDWFETLEGITIALDDRGCLVISFDSGENFVTNDLAEIKDANHFKITGRFDHIIITGGKKVNPYEVEKKLSAYIDSPYIVTSVPDYKWGSKVVLKIEDGVSNLHNDDELLIKIKGVLQPHEVPKCIEHVDSLPRTENGKIKR